MTTKRQQRRQILLQALFPALDSVVFVDVAGGAQGFVVEAHGAGDLFEFFAELVEGVEVVGGRWDLEVAGFEELLVAAVEEAGDLSVEEEAGAGEELDGSVGGGGDLGGTAVFPYLKGL